MRAALKHSKTDLEAEQCPSRKKTSPPPGKPVKELTPEEMCQELEYLRAENAYLKKLGALIQEKRLVPRKKH
jgi:transposase